MENEHLGVEIMTQNQSEGKVEQSGAKCLRGPCLKAIERVE